MKNGKYNLAKAPKEYPADTYRLGLVPEQHLVWWEEHGEVVQEDEVIHHKNGDTTDNRIENLEKMKKSEHDKHHAEEKKRTYVKIKCPNCGDKFTKEKRQTFLSKPNIKATFCSGSCSTSFYSSGNNMTEEKAQDSVIEMFMGD